MHPRHWLLVILGILFALYCFFQARFLILGPRVVIESPRDGEVLSGPTVTLSGTARNAAWLTLNGAQIFTNKDGQWSEKLILPQGVSIMTATVRDRFGRERTTEIRVISQ
jgi:hypothetical protein